ncbi:bacterial polymer biosynthesis protein, WecB/TagA/CpsF family [Clostridium sartagoforme AAU1]|uniref:Bacterial polymer biosynthesis protein, WecB/TagA/CpsF family n=1 Tax=Clostridium sartagoforme AAU1 TaxID=1202534 RepID=R9CG36_9CLOT|nr:WecB/TagA/CpsF family glycosyltransferase [Clostridium sartagoforme]EOR28257.1 bacterial polymer biosynthesis protein, WecB/TagA/CpsF family [Clostridium sartagoforme AAU1]
METSYCENNKMEIDLKTCNILGVNINVTNMRETIKFIISNIQNLKGNYICISNVHTTVMAYENEHYKSIQNFGVLALPDGGPLSVVSKIRGFNEAERVTGPDLMGEIFKISKEKGYKHYFYGSTEETLENLIKNIKNKFPNLEVVGAFSPPFRELNDEEDKVIIKEINSRNADFVWVGLGAPKQEEWMYKHKNKVNSVMIGVGAGFDYYAERIKRAPIWMQKHNLEWLFRLAQDPKRLFKRYLVTNSKFIYLNIKHLGFRK